MKRFFKIMLIISAPFCVAFTLVVGSRFGLDAALGVGVAVGLTTGLIAAGIMTAMIAHGERNPGNSKLRRSSRHLLIRDYETAFGICLEALDGLNRKYEVKVSDPVSGDIVVSTGMNWKSFGDRIAIRLNRDGDESTEVQVDSQPIIRMTRVDYGSNQQNIEAIGRILTPHEAAA